MNILVLNYEFPPLGGGASSVSYELAKFYTRMGHQVDVVTMGYRGLPAYEEKEGVHIYRVWSLRRKRETCDTLEMASFLLPALIQAIKLHQKNHYDINHTHFIIPTGIVSYLLKKFTGLNYIITSHGSDVPGFNPDRFTLEHKLTKQFLSLIARNARTIICPSDFLKNLIETEISNKLSVVVIPNGIDSRKFKPKAKKKTIIATGRLLPRKGFQYLIKAVSGLKLDCVVQIVGDGPMMLELKRLAEKAKTEIVFHGWLDNESEEFKRLIGSASIFCLPSSVENVSSSLLEAMGAGCAVVATNVTGIPEIIGKAGILVVPENPLKLQEALLRLIKNPKLAEEKGKMARKRIEEKYDWQLIVREYEKVLSKPC